MRDASLIKRMSQLSYIESDGLVIHRCSMLDVPEEILEARNESQEDLKQWMGWAQEPATIEGIEQELKDAEMLRSNLAAYRFYIYKKSDNKKFQTAKFLGSIGIIRYGPHGISAEVGYWMRSSEQKKGYTRQALAMLTLYLHKIGVQRVEVRADIDNHRSIGVAASIGFKMEGVLKFDRIKMDGRLSSTAVLALIHELDQLKFDFQDIKFREFIDGTEHVSQFSSI